MKHYSEQRWFVALTEEQRKLIIRAIRYCNDTMDYVGDPDKSPMQYVGEGLHTMYWTIYRMMDWTSLYENTLMEQSTAITVPSPTIAEYIERIDKNA